MPQTLFDVDAARKDGYSDTEIADHLAKTNGFDAAAARRDGYTDLELIGHFNKPPAVAAATTPPPQAAPAQPPPPVAPPRQPMTQDQAGAAMDETIMRGYVGAPPRSGPAAPPPVTPFYQIPEPQDIPGIPGTARTGLPGVQSAPQPNVHYDPFGARPDAGYQARMRAGLPPEPGSIPDVHEMPNVGTTLYQHGAQGSLGLFRDTGKALEVLGTGSVRGGGIGLRQAGEAIKNVSQIGLDLLPPEDPEATHLIGDKSFTEDPTQLLNPYYMAKQAGQAGGSMVAFMAPEVALLSRAGLAISGARSTMIMSIGETLANSAEVYDEAEKQAKAEGKTDQEAALIAHSKFLRHMPKDFVGTYTLNRLGIFNDKIRNPWVRGGAGTLGESAQEVYQNAATQHSLGRDPWKNWGESALGGAIGGPIGTAMHPGTYTGEAPAPHHEIPVSPRTPGGMSPQPYSNYAGKAPTVDPYAAAEEREQGPIEPSPGVQPPDEEEARQRKEYDLYQRGHLADFGVGGGAMMTFDEWKVARGGAPPGGIEATWEARQPTGTTGPPRGPHHEIPAFEFAEGGVRPAYPLPDDERIPARPTPLEDQGKPPITPAPTVGQQAGQAEGAAPPPAVKLEGEDLYQDAVQFASRYPQLGVTAIAKNYGIPKDEARVLLDRLVADGLFGTKTTRDGRQVYINLAKQAERPEGAGSPLITKKADDIATQVAGQVAEPGAFHEGMVAPPINLDQIAPEVPRGTSPPAAPPATIQGKEEETQGIAPPPSASEQAPPPAPAAPEVRPPGPTEVLGSTKEEQDALAERIRQEHAQEPDWYQTDQGEGPRPPWSDVVERYAQEWADPNRHAGTIEDAAFDAINDFRKAQPAQEGMVQAPAVLKTEEEKQAENEETSRKQLEHQAAQEAAARAAGVVEVTAEEARAGAKHHYEPPVQFPGHNAPCKLCGKTARNSIHKGVGAKLEQEQPKPEQKPGPTPAPWEMTLEEVNQTGYIARDVNAGNMPVVRPAMIDAATAASNASEHKRIVAEAVARGKPVPEKVLAEYPDLAPAKEEGKAPPPRSPETGFVAGGRPLSPKAQASINARILNGQNRIVDHLTGLTENDRVKIREQIQKGGGTVEIHDAIAQALFSMGHDDLVNKGLDTEADFVDKLVEHGRTEARKGPEQKALDKKTAAAEAKKRELAPPAPMLGEQKPAERKGQKPKFDIGEMTPPGTQQKPPAQVKAGQAKLPKELSKAAPRFGYGNKNFELAFDSDVDRAAYITAQKTRSTRDSAYLKFVMDATGMSEAEVRAAGADVRSYIKDLAATADPAAGPLKVSPVLQSERGDVRGSQVAQRGPAPTKEQAKAMLMALSSALPPTTDKRAAQQKAVEEKLKNYRGVLMNHKLYNAAVEAFRANPDLVAQAVEAIESGDVRGSSTPQSIDQQIADIEKQLAFAEQQLQNLLASFAAASPQQQILDSLEYAVFRHPGAARPGRKAPQGRTGIVYANAAGMDVFNRVFNKNADGMSITKRGIANLFVKLDNLLAGATLTPQQQEAYDQLKAIGAAYAGGGRTGETFKIVEYRSGGGSPDIKRTIREELMHGHQREVPILDSVVKALMDKHQVLKDGWKAISERGYDDLDNDPIGAFEEITAKVLAGQDIGFSEDQAMEVAEIYREALLDHYGVDVTVLFRYVKSGVVKEVFRGTATRQEVNQRAAKVQPGGGVELQRGPDSGGPGAAGGAGREGSVPKRAAGSLEEAARGAAQTKLTKEATAGGPAPGALFSKRKPAPSKLPERTPTRRNTRELATQLLGDIARGLVKPGGVERHLVKQYGEEAREIAKQIAAEVRRLVRNPETTHAYEAPTRQIESAKSPEYESTDHLLVGQGFDGRYPQAVETAAALIENYPGFRTQEFEDAQATVEAFVEHIKGNLIWLHGKYMEAHKDLIERAKLWYEGGRHLAERFAKTAGVEPHQMSGVIAVLSPKKDWFQNVDLARRLAVFFPVRNTIEWSDKMEAGYQQMLQSAANSAKSGARETQKANLEAQEEVRKRNAAAQGWATRRGEKFTPEVFEPKIFTPSTDLQEAYDRIKGKAYRDITDTYDQAVYARMWDEGHHSLDYNILSPEGHVLGKARNTKDTQNNRVVWAGYDAIQKAIAIMEDGSIENISNNLGEAHKVRSFYNNIVDPNNPNLHVTIDTHAVSAGLLRPLGENDPEVKHNLSQTSDVTGEAKTYGLIARAYREAAAEVGLLPREMQSITWEAVRGLFSKGFKNDTNRDALSALWDDVAQGTITADAARDQIYERAGGIDRPSWADKLPEGRTDEEASGQVSDTQDDGQAGQAADEGGVRESRASRREPEPAPAHRTGSGTAAQVPAPKPGVLERLDAAGKKADERLRKSGIYSGGSASANRFLDPQVIRDMAVSIAGDVARGTITARNFLSQTTERFGRGARGVSRKVYRQAHALRRREDDGIREARRRPRAQQAPGIAHPGLHFRPPALKTAPTSPTPAQAQALQEFEDEAKNWRVDPNTTWWSKAKEWLLTIGHNFTREYTHLPNGETYSPVKMELKKVNAAKVNSEMRAHQALKDQLDGMEPRELEQMMNVIVLNDLHWRVERQISEGGTVEDKDLPWNLTKKKLAEARSGARKIAKANPKIAKALTLRRQMQDEIRTGLISAFRRAGYKDLAEVLSNPHYYRHRVMDYVDNQEATGGGQRFKLPVGRGYLKKSHVNQKAYSLDYMRTEWQVMNQMMFDTARAEFLAYIRDPKNKLNKAKEVQKKAAELNKATIMPHFARMAKHHNRTNPGGVTHTAETMYQHVMAARPKDPGFRERMTRQLAGKHYMTFKATFNRHFSETHGLYQPVDGHHFFLASSIPEDIANEALANGEAKVLKEQIRKIIARGQKREELVLPKELITTLEEFHKPGDPKSPSEIAAKVWGIPTSLWKQSRLISPLGVVIYNERNLSGDLWRVLTVLPRAFKHIPQAWRDLKAMRTKGHPPNADFNEWWKRGGYQANLQTAEMGDIKVERKLRDSLVKINPTLKGKALKAATWAWDKLWWGRKWTDIREGLLRYATYLEFLDQLRKSPTRQPKTFAASIRSEVLALNNVHDRAFKLSNDMMLAYDEISPGGKLLRRYPIPFYSFTEQNLRTHKRLIWNAAADGRYAAAVGYALAGGATQTAGMAWRGSKAAIGASVAIHVGAAAIKMLGLKALLTAMNWNLWDDEEEDIPDSVKKDTHMIFGRDPEGHPIGFTRVGIADDVLDWAGLNGLPYQAREYLNGRMTLQEWADEYFFKYKGYTIPVPFIKPSINKLAQGMAPWPKYAMELWSGKSMFPDVYNPRTIRNRGQYIARELGLLYPYNYVMDIPQPAISWRSALKLVAYTWEPKQTHYNAFRYDKVPMWVAEHSSRGRSLGGFSESAEAEALYLIREAVKYGNRSALLRGIDEYKQAGGTVPNLDKAITRLHPLGALKEAEWKVYRKSLSRKENAQLEQAILFWKINFDNKRSEIKRAARERRLPLTKARK